MIKKLIHFFTHDLWAILLRERSGINRFAIKYLRIVVIAGRQFIKDNCALRASALTFYSLLSLVPLVAMILAIARGFGLDNVLQRQLQGGAAWQNSAMQSIVHYSYSLLTYSRGGIVTGIGVLVLFWSVISMMGNIEDSFNDIWNVTQARTMARKAADYLSAVMVGAVLFIAASSLTVMLSGNVAVKLPLLSKLVALLNPFVLVLLKALPYVIIWLLLTFTYKFMPHTRVGVAAAFTGGIIAGTSYQIAQSAYIKFQVGVASYGAVYGSFAALPLFLVWLQISWYIVLFGAEITRAAESAETYGFKPDYETLSVAQRRMLALRIIHYLARRFAQQEPPADAAAISRALMIPLRLVQGLIRELVSARLVSETGREAVAYQPAADIENMRIKSVLEALDNTRTQEIPPTDAADYGRISESIKTFNALAEQSQANVRVVDIPT